MNELSEKLKQDIKEFEDKCKKLSMFSTEYSYWNGCRCQAEVTLKFINENKHYENNKKIHFGI